MARHPLATPRATATAALLLTVAATLAVAGGTSEASRAAQLVLRIWAVRDRRP